MFFVYSLIAILPLADHHFFGTEYGPLTPFKYLGILCALYAVWRWAARGGNIRLLATTQSRLLVLYFAIAFASACTLIPAGLFPQQPVTIYIACLVLYFVCVITIDTPQRLKKVILCAVFAQVWSTYYVLSQRFVLHIYRPDGAVGDANYYALCALTAVPMAYCFMNAATGRIERLFFAASLVILLFGITVSGSRGGFLGLSAEVIFLVLKSRRPIRAFIVMTLVAVPMLVALPDSPVYRLLHPNYGDNIGTDSRTEVWKAGLRMIESSPIFGIGLGRFKPSVESFENGGDVKSLAHNTYLEISAELGLPALAVFSAIIFYSLRTLDRLRRQTLRDKQIFLYNAVFSHEVALVGLLVSSMFLTAEYQKNFWLAFYGSMFVPPVIRAVNARARRAASPTSGRPQPALVPASL